MNEKEFSKKYGKIIGELTKKISNDLLDTCKMLEKTEKCERKIAVSIALSSIGSTFGCAIIGCIPKDEAKNYLNTFYVETLKRIERHNSKDGAPREK